MVPDVGIELTTYRLQGGCSTTELNRQFGVGDRSRTCINRGCNPVPSHSGHTNLFAIQCSKWLIVVSNFSWYICFIPISKFCFWSSLNLSQLSSSSWMSSQTFQQLIIPCSRSNLSLILITQNKFKTVSSITSSKCSWLYLGINITSTLDIANSLWNYCTWFITITWVNVQVNFNIAIF